MVLIPSKVVEPLETEPDHPPAPEATQVFTMPRCEVLGCTAQGVAFGAGNHCLCADHLAELFADGFETARLGEPAQRRIGTSSHLASRPRAPSWSPK